MAKGISELIKFLRPLGEIVVMAPDAPRSGLIIRKSRGCPDHIGEIILNLLLPASGKQSNDNIAGILMIATTLRVTFTGAAPLLAFS